MKSEGKIVKAEFPIIRIRKRGFGTIIEPALLFQTEKPFGSFTFPAANGIAGGRLRHGFLSFGFSLIKVFDHLLEFRI